MATFALVSEGITDQIVLERIIEVVCADHFEGGVDVNPLQPLRDATDSKTAPHGGWELVLEYCQNSASAALEANDYLVIHLDTDQGDHPNFGLALTDQGKDRACDVLVEDAIEIVKKRLGPEIYAAHADRFLFAISVHTMESWLLLCIFNYDEPKNSFYRLNKYLAKADEDLLTKESKRYQKFCKNITKSSFKKMIEKENSLSLFLRGLASIQK